MSLHFYATKNRNCRRGDNVYVKYDSKWGEMVLNLSNQGALKGLWFIGQKYFPKLDGEIYYVDEIHSLPNEMLEVITKVITQLKEYENGKRKEFNLKLEPEGTFFQKEVWKILLSIPYGKTITYGEIGDQVARKLNKKSMSAQAVGQAVGHNPISVIIPCHRVIGKKNELTGYAGGIEKKIALLELEGVL